MDEYQLLKDCLAGKRHAQKLLYEKYARKMFGVCIRYASDQSMAEDFMQEGFIRVFANLKSFKSQGSLEGWVRRIMINTALEMLRKKDILKNTVELDLVSQVDEPDESIEVVNHEELLKIIKSMPPGFRTIFNLHAVEGFTHKEIGQMIGVSEGTSKSQYSRARAWIIKKIKENNLVNER
jgi:RNA polymerase sigma-70 factor (ECF subfamily)